MWEKIQATPIAFCSIFVSNPLSDAKIFCSFHPVEMSIGSRIGRTDIPLKIWRPNIFSMKSRLSDQFDLALID
jgi:hypothetical protein